MAPFYRRPSVWSVCALLALAATIGPGLTAQDTSGETSTTEIRDMDDGIEPLLVTDANGTPLSSIIEKLWLSASLRVRPEYSRKLTDFDDQNFDFISNRARLGIGADFAGNASMFLEVQNNSTWGDSATFMNFDPIDDDEVNVYQAFFQFNDIGGSNISIKGGRQELVYGTEMLLGDADFLAGLNHDGVVAMWEEGGFSVHAWYVKLVERDSVPSPVPDSDDDADFYGIYGNFEQDRVGVDAYYLLTNDRGTAVEDERHTLGFRAYAGIGENVELSGEAAWQFGDTGTTENDIRAFAVELLAKLGLDGELAPYFEAGYAFASGDPDPTDSRSETFNPLFQDNHPRYGLSDIILLENIHVVTTKGQITPRADVDVGIGYYLYWVHRTQDTVGPRFLTPGLGPTAGSGSRYVGSELNIYTNWRIHENIFAQAAWAHIFAGSYLRNQFNSRDDADRLYFHFVLGF